MAKTTPTILDAIQDKECAKYVSMVVQDPREIFDAYTETMDELDQKVLVETSQGDIEFRNFNGTSKTTLPLKPSTVYLPLFFKSIFLIISFS